MVPEDVITDQGVCDDEEFAHAGGHGDYVGFAVVEQACQVFGDLLRAADSGLGRSVLGTR